MKRIICMSLFVVSALPVDAQSLQLGAHFNPAITVPVAGEKSSVGNIKSGSVSVGYNVGLNLQWQKGNWALEFAPGLLRRNLQFGHRLNGAGYMSSINIKAYGMSIEAPLLVKGRIAAHRKKNAYDVYAVVGGAWEYYMYDGSGVSAVVGGGEGTTGAGVKTDKDVVLYADSEKQWFSAIAGFEIQTTIKRFGDIAYGITYHMPLSRTGEYDVKYTLIQNTQSTQYSGSFNSYLSYIDVKLCYYFWNLNKKG